MTCGCRLPVREGARGCSALVIRPLFYLCNPSQTLAQDFTPQVSRSDGTEVITVVGENFVIDPVLVFSSPMGEQYVSEGYESKHGGDYNLLPVTPVAPTPTPVPTPSPTYEEPYLSYNTLGSTFREFWPSERLASALPPVISANTTHVVTGIPPNHAVGQFVRVRIQSPIDKVYLFSDRHFVPFYRPTVQSVFPPSLPLSGGIITLRGHSFGNGGRVLIKQRLFFNSSSVPGDEAYPGLYTLQHEADRPGYAHALFLAGLYRDDGLHPLPARAAHVHGRCLPWLLVLPTLLPCANVRFLLYSPPSTTLHPGRQVLWALLGNPGWLRALVSAPVVPGGEGGPAHSRRRHAAARSVHVRPLRPACVEPHHDSL